MSMAPTSTRALVPIAVNKPPRYNVLPESCIAFTIAPLFSIVVGEAASAPVVASTAANPGRAVPEAVANGPPRNTVPPLTARTYPGPLSAGFHGSRAPVVRLNAAPLPRGIPFTAEKRPTT